MNKRRTSYDRGQLFEHYWEYNENDKYVPFCRTIHVPNNSDGLPRCPKCAKIASLKVKNLAAKKAE